MKTLFLMYVVFGIAAMNQIIGADREFVRDLYRPRRAQSTSSVDQNNNSSREPNRNSSTNNSRETTRNSSTPGNSASTSRR